MTGVQTCALPICLNSITTYVNGIANTGASTSTVGALDSSKYTLTIGRSPDGYQNMDMELVSAVVFRRILTSNEISLLTNYFNRRSL